MSGWMADMADLVDAAEAAAPAPPLTKAPSPESMRTVSIDDTPTEPATSPRVIEVGLTEPASIDGKRRYKDGTTVIGIERIESVVKQNYGRKKHMNGVSKNGKLRLIAKASRIIQAFHVARLQRRLRPCVFCPMSMKLSVRTILLWLQGRNQSSRKLRHPREGRCRKVSTLTRNLQGLVQHQCSPCRHRRPRPWEAQPPGVSLPLAATPMTPGHPPRPPVEALPKQMPMEIQATNKHPVESSSQQGPPHKQARHKPFPFNQPPPVSTSMASPSAVDMPRPGAPTPKGPPASFMPTPGDVQQMSSSSASR